MVWFVENVLRFGARVPRGHRALVVVTQKWRFLALSCPLSRYCRNLTGFCQLWALQGWARGGDANMDPT